jgi:hypothetical protein
MLAPIFAERPTMNASNGPAIVTVAGLRAEFTDVPDPTLARWIKAGKFPAPIGDINGRRIWDRCHLVEWKNNPGKIWSGQPDAGFAERQAAAQKRTEALRQWHASRRAVMESAAA